MYTPLVLHSPSLAAPVGPWGDPKSKNDPADVEQVQRLLKLAASRNRRLDPGVIDGKIGRVAARSATLRAVRNFQDQFMRRPDGRVDPGGTTLRHLAAISAGRDPFGASAAPAGVSALPPGFRAETWMRTAELEKGIKETPGAEATSRIVEYLESCKTTKSFTKKRQQTDESAWCAAFVNWVLKQARLRTPDTPWAPSWERYGKSLDRPVRGAITVVERSGGSRRHVALLSRTVGKEVVLLGGNQGNRVCEKHYPSSSVVTYRWPV